MPAKHVDQDAARWVRRTDTIIPAERSNLLEVLDDRVGAKSTLITSQLPVSAWHQWLDDPTLADAILDRIVHSAHRIELKGESLRKRPAKS